MPQCWAASLGGCHPEQSREHLVSASLWGGNPIDVIGFPWCRHTPKRVGVGSLTAKILCRSHNSALSPLDGAAKIGGAVASGFDTEQWTLKRSAHVIEGRFGVHYHYRYLERSLKAHGFSVQRPASRAKERDERVVAEWLRQTWPALEKKRGARGARSPCGMRRATRFASDCRRPGRGGARRPWSDA